MKKVRHCFLGTGILFLLFALFTAAVLTVDVRPIGPEHSQVGLAGINGFVFEHLGVNMQWYAVTDWLGIAELLVALGFGLLGIWQLLRRKSLLNVDARLLLLGAFYLLLLAAYIAFETFVVNYRPILMNSALEASFPSSHTMLVLCILGTAMLEFQWRIQNRGIRLAAQAVSAGIIAVTVVGRLLSGVHWFTDILGGILLGGALVLLYYSAALLLKHKGINTLKAPPNR